MDSRKIQPAKINDKSEERPIGPDLGELSHATSPSSTVAIYHGTERKATSDEFKNYHASKVNVYSEDLKKYISMLERNPMSLDVLKDLPSNHLSDCRDALTKEIARIPVFLDNRLYNLDTLLGCQEHNGFRKDPVTQKEFFLLDIRPAFAKQTRIQEMIKLKIEEQAQEKKYSAQAQIFIASAERARKQQRSKCVIS